MRTLYVKTTDGNLLPYDILNDKAEDILDEFKEKLTNKHSERWLEIAGRVFNLANIIYIELLETE